MPGRHPGPSDSRESGSGTTGCRRVGPPREASKRRFIWAKRQRIGVGGERQSQRRRRRRRQNDVWRRRARQDYLRVELSMRIPIQLPPGLYRNGKLTRLQAIQIGRGRGHHLVLGPYLLLDRLGGGGMGRVFLARNVRLNKLAAIKLIRLDRRHCRAFLRFYPGLGAYVVPGAARHRGRRSVRAGLRRWDVLPLSAST